MTEERRDTVVVEKEGSSNPVGWIIGVVVVIILLALFFMYGGFGLLNGGGSTVNVNTSGAPATGQ
jgi:hypothetical protein